MDLLQFKDWADKLGLTEETINEIQKVRLAPPARRVGGGKQNVSGRYSSRKMQCTIQFESHKVELPTIFELEFNDDVLEYYDQPTQIKVMYNKNNKTNAYWKTADFFVIEKEKAYWLECKTEEELISLSQKNPDRYYLLNDSWIFEPGIVYAEKFNLEFIIKSSKTINWILQRNIIFLEDYLIRNYKIDNKNEQKIKDIISSHSGITLEQLMDLSSASTDDIYILIAKQIIYVDLNRDLLIEPNKTMVYLSNDQYKSLTIVSEVSFKNSSSKIELEPGKLFNWRNSGRWKILNIDYVLDKVFIYNESNNKYLELPIGVFEGYISKGYITGIVSDLESEKQSNLKSIISSASDSDLSVANKRYEIVVDFLNGLKIEGLDVTDRTLRNWVKKYKEANELYGNGFVGLLPQTKHKGNREGKIPLAAKELMENVIKNNYDTIKQKSAKAVYRELLVKCDELNIEAPSYQSFCKTIKNRSVYATTKARKGERAAYNNEELYTQLEFTTPKHGDRVFEIVHIDHTELDIELMISENHSARPWLTLMVDAYSRKLLAYYLTFEPPSYRSCMMVLRECVKKYNRLPNYIVVDGGKEFASVNFESLLALYGVHKKQRPPAKARFGNIVERLFGVSNSMLIHNLQGNTQITKNVRQVTKSVNPKNHAIWTLSLLDELLGKWFDEVYDHIVNPTLQQTPNQIYKESIKKSGERLNTYINYDETFIILTSPSPDKKTRKVYPGRGIKLTYLYYWCDEFRNPLIENSIVEVKYDPFNIAIAYAFIQGRWVKCIAEQAKYLFDKSEREVRIIAEEIRKRNTLNSRSNTITSRHLASFIIEAENTERVLNKKSKENSSEESHFNKVLKSIDNEIKNGENDDLIYEELEFFKELDE